MVWLSGGSYFTPNVAISGSPPPTNQCLFCVSVPFPAKLHSFYCLARKTAIDQAVISDRAYLRTVPQSIAVTDTSQICRLVPSLELSNRRMPPPAHDLSPAEIAALIGPDNHPDPLSADELERLTAPLTDQQLEEVLNLLGLGPLARQFPPALLKLMRVAKHIASARPPEYDDDVDAITRDFDLVGFADALGIDAHPPTPPPSSPEPPQTPVRPLSSVLLVNTGGPLGLTLSECFSKECLEVRKRIKGRI
ncbi:hypothetical protein C8R47DRAFT_1067858 [Mycena vitilis]|nr:hypothetical protein C8R47DRAFT_1067858 [Mycena vitilis]